jgi:hypothetical protein
MIHFVVDNWIIIMASVIIALNIIAIIAMVFARRAMESVFSSLSSRLAREASVRCSSLLRNHSSTMGISSWVH